VPRLCPVPATDRLKRLEERTRYVPADVEGEIFALWEKSGIFHPEPEGTADENYSIAVPPPNVTGALHMGHALNGSIQDVLIRVHRMRGERTKWIFGTDHAGIATQIQVEKKLATEGKSKEDLGRERFIDEVWKWREQYGGTITEQFKRLGASLDYEDERFTMDREYQRAVIHVFVKLYEKGLIYRDYYMVNWDPGMQSAISDLEVEQREVQDTLFMVDYPLESGGGSITVATVRPETMLADTAIAVNPNDERYTRLIGEAAILPLVGRKLPIIADEYVDPEFGTGALKITPGHDPNDFEIGRRHKLASPSVIGEDGRMTEEAGERFAGMEIDDARQAVIEELRKQGLISGTQPYIHDVPHSQRSGRRIEPLISLQWFCDQKQLAEPAIEAAKDGSLRFHPEKPWTGVYLNWLENIRPWCISRQLWWGHQIPVWYCENGDNTICDMPEDVPERCPKCGGRLERDPDVLDTWFSSALWPFATLGWPEATPELRAFYPTDVNSTARDIIFLWVARMVMMGIRFTERLPFTDVNIHSVIQAPDGRRMSKSLGTGIDPVEEIDEHGADAVRFGLLAMSSSQDVRYSPEKVKQGRDLANKLWNASRLILLRVDDVAAEPRPETVEDRWIVSRIERATQQISQEIDEFQMSRAALDLYDVFWSEVCDWYLELVKPRLYDDDADRSALSATLLHVLERSLTLLHPLMPFVTEEVWRHMPGERGLLAVAPWPQVREDLIDERAEAELERVKAAVTALRRYRDDVGAPAGAKIAGRLEADGYDTTADQVARLARFEFHPNGTQETAAAIAIPGGAVKVLAGGDIDPQEAAKRVAQQRQKLEGEIKRAEGKLANESFVSKAPPQVVEAEREKLERYRAELRRLESE
jgi:valyl-tRNA synthetase